jgi:hypothetical protein
MSFAVQLINFNCNTKESAIIHKTIKKYDPDKYCHCFRGSDNENLTPKFNKQLNGGN